MELGQSNSFCFLHICQCMEYCISYCFLSYMFSVSVTAHLLYELVCMYLHLLPGGGSSYYAQKQQTALYFVFYLMEAFSGMCFLFGFFLSFFPQGGFWRGFFPWTCWPHVLNKSVLCWLIPVIWNVCFCVIWTSCFYFALLSISISARCPILHPFLHVAQSLFKMQ